MIKPWEEMTRADFVWLTLYAAMLQAVVFGLTDHYFGAFLCVCYDLAIVLLNLIAETRDKRKRDCANREK